MEHRGRLIFFMVIAVAIATSDAFMGLANANMRQRFSNFPANFDNDIARLFMTDVANESSSGDDGVPTVNSNLDNFSSARYLDNLPVSNEKGSDAKSSASSKVNPYITWLESASPDAPSVSPWDTSLRAAVSMYRSDPPATPVSNQLATEAENLVSTSNSAQPTTVLDDSLLSATEKMPNADKPLETTVTPTTPVPATQWIVWKERTDTSRFGIRDARNRVSPVLPPKPLNPDSPEGTTVTQTFFLGDDMRTSNESDYTLSDDQGAPVSSMEMTKEQVVKSSGGTIVDDDNMDSSDENIATATSPKPIGSNDPTDGPVTQTFFLGDENRTVNELDDSLGIVDDQLAKPSMDGPGENNTQVAESIKLNTELSAPATPIVVDTDVPLATAVPPTMMSSANPWIIWKERKDTSRFGIQNRFEAREKQGPLGPPKPIDPNSLTGSSSVTQTFFLGDDIQAMYESDTPLLDNETTQIDPAATPTAEPSNDIVASDLTNEPVTVPSSDTVVENDGKSTKKMQEEPIDMILLQDQKFMRLAIALASTE
jgi:hypothetical protein